MRRVGTVRRVAQGLAIARAPDDPPAEGTEVLDEGLDAVGEVVAVFGPVQRPYVAVKPDDDRPLAPLLGEPLYAR